jgi:hypothetical protein
MEEYRLGYIGKGDDLNKNANLEFYRNTTGMRPSGRFIDDVLRPQSDGGYFGDYSQLELDHGYIQWLFPLRSMSGSNAQSQELYLHEAVAMRSDADVKRRYFTAYRLILDFYGAVLLNNVTGELARSANYVDRFNNLQTNTHNYLRISRLLKSMGELDLESLKFGFLKFFANEVYVNNQISNCKGECEVLVQTRPVVDAVVALARR